MKRLDLGAKQKASKPRPKCVIASVDYRANVLTCSCRWSGTTNESDYQKHRIAMGNRRGITSHLVNPTD